MLTPQANDMPRHCTCIRSHAKWQAGKHRENNRIPSQPLLSSKPFRSRTCQLNDISRQGGLQLCLSKAAAAICGILCTSTRGRILQASEHVLQAKSWGTPRDLLPNNHAQDVAAYPRPSGNVSLFTICLPPKGISKQPGVLLPVHRWPSLESVVIVCTVCSTSGKIHGCFIKHTWHKM